MKKLPDTSHSKLPLLPETSWLHGSFTFFLPTSEREEAGYAQQEVTSPREGKEKEETLYEKQQRMDKERAKAILDKLVSSLVNDQHYDSGGASKLVPKKG